MPRLLQGASYFVWVRFNPLSELVGSRKKELCSCCLRTEQSAGETRLTLCCLFPPRRLRSEWSRHAVL